MAVTVLAPVIKSQNDKREYRAVRLENGMTILLVSDLKDEANQEGGDGVENKSEKLSAAALCVGVGSFSDPADIPGMAHFLEHMVFMGSEKYPDENDFDAFVKKHGGNTNAFTDCERTCFYFDVKRKNMYDALDRFAQFFISPLMKKDSVDREVQAVDSEFQMALQGDHNRKEQLLSHIARDGHPMNKFMWGSKLSIKDTPEKEGINLYERLQEFHKTHYSSHHMTLAIQSRHSLDMLQEWTTEIFSSVTNNILPRPVFDTLDKPYDTPAFFKLYKSVPIKKIHQVEITWALPCLQQKYRMKPLHYLGWLVGHEGPGSILSYLKKKVWALSLCGGNSESGFEHNTSGAMFSVSATLTEQGMDHILEVITVILQYMEMLRKVGPQKRIYDEIQTIEANDFMWQEQMEPSDTVEKLAENMQLFPPGDYLTGESLLYEYDEQLIAECTEHLVPERATYVLYSKRFAEDEVCDKTEPWFNIPYSVTDVPAHWLKSWKNLKENADLHLPAENTYISTDFSLKEPDREATVSPEKISDTPSSKLWYKKDTKFKVPKAYFSFKLFNPMVADSAKNAALCDLFLKTLEHNLSVVTYAANCAQLTYSISADSTGLKLKFQGFNHKLRGLFCTVIDYIASFSCPQDVFEALMDQLKRIYYNRVIKPDKMSVELRLNILMSSYWSTVDKSRALEGVTRQDLLDFAARLRSTLFVEGLVQGNMTAAESLELERYILDTLKSQPLEKDKLGFPRVYGLPEGELYCRVENFNKSDNNSVITNYYQHGPTDLYKFTLNELLITHMEEPCYAVLRTREQLGYHVYCTCRNTEGILALSVTVCSQANKFTMAQLDEHIEKFLVEFGGTLDSMTEEDFNTLVTSLITLKRCEDTHLGEEVDRNWGEICQQEYVFDRLVKQVEALQKMTLPEMRTWFIDHVTVGGKHRKLGIQILGNEHAAQRKRKLTGGDDNEDDDADKAEGAGTGGKKSRDTVSEDEEGESDEEDESGSEYSDEEDEDDMSEDDMDDMGDMDNTTAMNWTFLSVEDGQKEVKDLNHLKESLTLYPLTKVL